jgi:hypothetical protein
MGFRITTSYTRGSYGLPHSGQNITAFIQVGADDKQGVIGFLASQG